MAGLMACAWSLPSHSQENGPLRGTVSETEITGELLADTQAELDTTPTGSTEDTGIPAPAYRPVSPGALPDEADGDRTSREADDPFTASREPFETLNRTATPRMPSTARARNRARSQNRDVERDEAEEAAARQNAREAVETEESQGLTTGTVRARPADAVGVGSEGVPQPLNRRAGAIEGRERRVEEDPYAPLGLRAGSFIVTPTLEQGLTWTSNADYEPEGEEAVLSETTLRLNAVSGWSRHRATIDARGTYRKSVSGEPVSELEGGIDGALELDLGAELQALATLGYSARPESASSPVIIDDVADRPVRQTFQGGLGLRKELGKLRFGVTGDVVRNQYGDAKLTTGTVISQDDRNSTLAAVRLRGGYRISPAVTPFLEAEAGRRIYDRTVDGAGYERAALRLGARAGVELDIREKLTGEASLGWISEDFDDDRLATISGLSVDANLAWSPIRGTIVRLEGSTEIEGTTTPDESGSVLYSGAVRLERRLRANLTGEALLGASWRDYTGSEGRELTLAGQASLTWWLNRTTGLTGRARHERKTSNLPGRDYEVTSIFMGMKLQR